jgi:hypothetical protein
MKKFEALKRSGQIGNNNFQNQTNQTGKTVVDEFGNIVK